MTDLTIIIPTRNSPLLRRVMGEIYELIPDVSMLVVGHNSPNTTRTTVEEFGGQFINEPKPGKAAALATAFQVVQTVYTIMLDADFTYPAYDVYQVAEKLRTGADVVLGYRKWRYPGSMTSLNRIGNIGLSLMASVLYGYHVKDVCSGLWGFRTEVVKTFQITSSGFALEADLFINTVLGKHQLVQIPIVYRAQPTYKKGIGIKEGQRIGKFLLTRRYESSKGVKGC